MKPIPKYRKTNNIIYIILVNVYIKTYYFTDSGKVWFRNIMLSCIYVYLQCLNCVFSYYLIEFVKVCYIGTIYITGSLHYMDYENNSEFVLSDI